MTQPRFSTLMGTSAGTGRQSPVDEDRPYEYRGRAGWRPELVPPEPPRAGPPVDRRPLAERVADAAERRARFCELREQGATPEEMAAVLGVSLWTVRKYRRDMKKAEQAG